MDLKDSLTGLGRPGTYYPSLAKLIGVKESIFFCNLAWWNGKQRDPDGWIYKSQDEIEDETGLSKEEQRTSRKNLKAKGFIEEKVHRLEHRTFYRVVFDVINGYWHQSCSEPLKSSPEVGNPDAGKSGSPAPPSGEPLLRLDTSSTSSSTTSLKEGEGVAEIYEAYPKKVGKPEALRAIAKAVAKHGVSHIIERTKAYALARLHEDPQFTPHPSTFFNQERYNDDPSTWKKQNERTRSGTYSANSKPNPRNDGVCPSPPGEISTREFLKRREEQQRRQREGGK